MAVKVLVVFICALIQPVVSQILVTPSSDQFISINSTGNVTFRCDVRGESQSQSPSAVWTVQGRLIQNTENPARSAFESIGIFINVIEEGVTEVIITERGRMQYFPSSITVQCSSLTSSDGLPVVTIGEELTVTTFGMLISCI